MTTFPLATSIDETITILDAITDWAVQHRDPLGYFTCLHRHTDMLMTQGIDKGLFADPNAVDALATSFCNTYIVMVNDRLNGITAPAWESALDPSLNPLQRVIMAINAHLRFDLGRAIAEIVSWGDVDLVGLRPDYDLIDTLDFSSLRLYGVTAASYSSGVALARPFVPTRVWERLLSRARRDAWNFGTELIEHPGWPGLVTKQLVYTERIAQRWRRGLRGFRWAEKDVTVNIETFRHAEHARSRGWLPIMRRWGH